MDTLVSNYHRRGNRHVLGRTLAERLPTGTVHSMRHPRRARRAFSLLEVIVSVVVLGVVAVAAYASFASVYKTEDEHRARQVAEAFEARARAIAVDVSADPQENPLKGSNSTTGYLNTATNSFTSGAVFSGVSDGDNDTDHVDDDGYVTMTWQGKVTVCIDFVPGSNPNSTNPTANASIPANISIGNCS
jgi:prepilin-type N-terminal cleavage/methylation domain-containing protein